MASLDCLSNFVVLSEYSKNHGLTKFPPVRLWQYALLLTFNWRSYAVFLQFKVKVQLLSIFHSLHIDL